MGSPPSAIGNGNESIYKANVVENQIDDTLHLTPRKKRLLAENGNETLPCNLSSKRLAMSQ